MIVKLEPGQAAWVQGKVDINGEVMNFLESTLVVARKHVEINTEVAGTNTYAIITSAPRECVDTECKGVVYV